MLMYVEKTRQLEDIKERDLIALILNEECMGYCVLFLKLTTIVLLEFDEEMSKILIERYGENIPFNFEIRGG